MTAPNAQPAGPGVKAPGALQMVAVALIDTDGKNLRRENGDVSGLRSSFESLGMLQPLTLRPIPGGRYELVAGHRRLSAALQSGAIEVPAIVREMDERQKWEARLGENLHRRDLTPSDEGRMYRQLLMHGYTERELAQMAGRSVSHISERMRLLEWPPEVIRQVDIGELTIAAARRKVQPTPAATRQRGGLPVARDEAPAGGDSKILNTHTIEEIARFLSAIADDEWAQGATRTKARRLLRAVSQALASGVAAGRRAS
jgi:ParB family chromosome partitioning protein